MGSQCWKTELREATPLGMSAVPSMLEEFLQEEPSRMFRYCFIIVHAADIQHKRQSRINMKCMNIQ